MTTGIIYVPGTEHTLDGHPEYAGRTAAIWERLTQSPIFPTLTQLDPIPATTDQLGRAHTRHHIELVESATSHGRIGLDTYVTPQTCDTAKRAAGSACALVSAIADGTLQNGMAIVRPPGHHAGSQNVEGFCLFNNIAIAARHAQAEHGIGRVAILDFDVHHGNGTQEIFYTDPTVLFASMHQYGAMFYPGSGDFVETGELKGNGMTINVPFPAGTGDKAYITMLDDVIHPLFEAFKPELLLVSAGFDAHWRDPLAYGNVTLAGFATIVQKVLTWADEWCDGKIMFVLEGGYNLESLSFAVTNTIHALAKRPDLVTDPLGSSGRPEPDVSELHHKIATAHLLR